jgi:hypothetical protein
MRTRFCIFVLAVVSVAGLFGQDQWVLRNRFQEGDKHDYDLTFSSTQTMKMEGGPVQEMPIDVAAKMKMLIGYGKTADDKSELSLNISEISWDFGELAGMVGSMLDQMPKDMQAKGKIDERNRISDLSMPGIAGKAGGPMGMMMGSGLGNGNFLGLLFLELPEAAVKTNDTWEVVLSNPMSKGGKSSIKATLVGEKTVDGRAAHQVSIKGVWDIDADMSELMKDNPQGPNTKMLAKGKIDVSGTAFLDKESGKTLKISFEMKSDQIVEMPDMGMKVGVAGTTTIRMIQVTKA